MWRFISLITQNMRITVLPQETQVLNVRKYFLWTAAIPRDILEFSKPGADVIGGSIVHTYSATYLGMAFRKHQYKLKTKKNHGITPGPYIYLWKNFFFFELQY